MFRSPPQRPTKGSFLGKRAATDPASRTQPVSYTHLTINLNDKAAGNVYFTVHYMNVFGKVKSTNHGQAALTVFSSSGTSDCGRSASLRSETGSASTDFRPVVSAGLPSPVGER